MNRESLQTQISSLKSLFSLLQKASSSSEKMTILNAMIPVQNFFSSHPLLQENFSKLPDDAKYVLTMLLAIGQGSAVFSDEDGNPSLEQLQELADILLPVEKFYDTIGGVIGYHLTVLQLLAGKPKTCAEDTEIHYENPEGIDLLQRSSNSDQKVRWGIELMGQMAEIYPIGGAGDRLQLYDDDTGELLPAAELKFCGRTLLEGLIRDLQGREYLYYKLMGKQLVTPIAMMTSQEKSNHYHINNICEELLWFGRPKESFKMFLQPLVPVITDEGNWVMSSPLRPALKPGGHGVIWKQAIDNGIFDWFESLGRPKALVRQINNPIAGTDNGFLALTGIGCHEQKDFGFASCFRLLNTSEGMNVLVEKKMNEAYEYSITNVEYTEFEKHGIKDVPAAPGSPYSIFPANTNILFIDLKAVREAVAICPIPGMLINMKNNVSCKDPQGREIVVRSGRLESTMQNIADYIVDRFKEPLEKGQQSKLRSFLTYNERRKTISVTKQLYQAGKPLIGTPEACLYEMLQNYEDLLRNYCGIEVPSVPSEKEYLQFGPPFLVQFHPAVGTLFTVISQKIRKGSIKPHSEWIIEAAEVDIENIELAGSLIIEASEIMGKKNDHGLLSYSSDNGKCVLKNVKIENLGMEEISLQNYWKNKITRLESLHILLHGNAEFHAENVTFKGDIRIEVPDGERVVARQIGEDIDYSSEPISSPSWYWKYSFGENDTINLQK